MGHIGIWQIIIILAIVVLIFGANRFPNIMRNLAEGMNSFKKTLDDEKKKPAKAPAKKAVRVGAASKNSTKKPSKKVR